MLTKFAPLPADAGGRQRSLAIMRRLARRGEVTLCAYDDGRADRAGLEAMGVRLELAPWRPSARETVAGLARSASLSAARFHSQALQGALRRALEPGAIDVLQVEYAQMAPAAAWVPAKVRVVDFHNVESNLALSYARARPMLASLPYRAESLALRRIEAAAVARADLSVVVSEVEARRLVGGRAAPLVCPNGWEPGPALPASPEKVAIFVAVLGWPPNAQAARWLLGEIWPLVRDRVPDARLLLVGKNPPADLAVAAERTGAEIVGPVPDVRPYLAAARVSVAPLLAGGGTRLKILEALDAGRPVVATPLAAEGLEDLAGEGLSLASGAQEVASRLAELLSDPARAEAEGKAGNRAIAARHSWDDALAPLFSALDSALRP